MESRHLKNMPEDMMGLIELLPYWEEFVKEQQRREREELEIAERVFGPLVREVFKNDPPEMFISNRARRRMRSS